ncbi:hypothetical protein P7C71_g4828, partial [Lecanoromycetidae sp. Uapishka_2]
MSRSTLLATAQSAIESYNKWDKSVILAVRAPDCIHQILPASTLQPPMNNEAYSGFLDIILPIFRDMHLTVHDATVDEVEKRVVMHASSKGRTDVGEYGNEYMFSMWMTDDGKMVKRLEEFADSKYSKDYFDKLRAAGGWDKEDRKE